MSFRSDYEQLEPRQKPRKTVDDIVNQVRAAAQQLVDDFAQMERWTQGWTDTGLTTSLVDVAMRRCLVSLSETDCWGDSNRMPSDELWRIAGRRLECGRLQHHARRKPRGYPGDYELIDDILESRSCSHPLGSALDHFFLNQGAAAAVRNRTRLLAAELVRFFLERGAEPMHIVSVGSGPASELRRFVELIDKDDRSMIRLTLLDVDPYALDYARGKLERLVAAERITTHQRNLFRLAEGRTSPLATCSVDFLFCPGLFDYLTDSSAAQMLEFLRRLLVADGQLIVGNFAPTNPSRAYMEWIGNWYLIYRDAASLLQIGGAAGIDRTELMVMAEPLGINQFLRITRSA